MSYYVVCIMEESLCYGGPEEGGWWYEAGYPCNEEEFATKMKVFSIKDDADKYCRLLNRWLGKKNKARYDYDFYSVCGGERLTATVLEDEMPAPYPQVRPHYE